MKKPDLLGSQPEQKLGVRPGLADFAQELLHRILRIELRQSPPQVANPFELIGVEKKLLAARSAAGQIDRRPNSSLDQTSVEHNFQIASPFELLEDNLIHLATGLDQGRRNNRERAPLFKLARCAE